MTRLTDVDRLFMDAQQAARGRKPPNMVALHTAIGNCGELSREDRARLGGHVESQLHNLRLETPPGQPISIYDLMDKHNIHKR